jgi:uncharacterized protein YnzC (UPF0291/DUF896 family)
MLTPEMIARINELARKQREGTLTETETAEQAHLRRLYIDVIKARVREQIETARPGDHPPGCRCGHHH